MSGRLGTEVRFFEALFSVGTTCGLSDAELLERFVSRNVETAEPAFESLMLRHGPMVLTSACASWAMCTTHRTPSRPRF